MHGDARRVAESHVTSPDEVREFDGQVLTVGVNVKTIGDVGDLSADGHQETVVVDDHSIDSIQVYPIERAQLGVTDGDTGAGVDNVGEGEGLKGRKSDEVDHTDFLQFGELQG